MAIHERAVSCEFLRRFTEEHGCGDPSWTTADVVNKIIKPVTAKADPVAAFAVLFTRPPMGGSGAAAARASRRRRRGRAVRAAARRRGDALVSHSWAGGWATLVRALEALGRPGAAALVLDRHLRGLQHRATRASRPVSPAAIAARGARPCCSSRGTPAGARTRVVPLRAVYRCAARRPRRRGGGGRGVWSSRCPRRRRPVRRRAHLRRRHPPRDRGDRRRARRRDRRRRCADPRRSVGRDQGSQAATLNGVKTALRAELLEVGRRASPRSARRRRGARVRRARDRGRAARDGAARTARRARRARRRRAVARALPRARADAGAPAPTRPRARRGRAAPAATSRRSRR